MENNNHSTFSFCNHIFNLLSIRGGVHIKTENIPASLNQSCIPYFSNQYCNKNKAEGRKQKIRRRDPLYFVFSSKNAFPKKTDRTNMKSLLTTYLKNFFLRSSGSIKQCVGCRLFLRVFGSYTFISASYHLPNTFFCSLYLKITNLLQKCNCNTKNNEWLLLHFFAMSYKKVTVL